MDKLTPNSSQTDQTENSVHTMPQKFLTMRPSFKSSPKKKSGSKKPMGFKKNLVIGIVITLAVGALMVFGAWMFLKTVDSDNSNPNPNLPVAGSNVPANNEEPANELPAEPKDDPYKEWLDFDVWDTHQFTEYNYSLKYPREWTSSEDVSKDPKTNQVSKTTISDNQAVEYLKITIFENTYRDDLENWIVDNQQIDSIDLESFTLAGSQSLKYEDPAGLSYNLYISGGEYIYSLYFKKETDQSINSVYGQIIQSFDFIEDPVELPPVIGKGEDTDSDGLTDAEEALFGTDKAIPDTDGDSYTDSEEVKNLYHPTAEGSTRIYESSLVSTYVSSKYNYNLIYPSSWTTKGSDDSIFFQDPGGEFIQILVLPNSEAHANITSWYKSNISINTEGLSTLKISDNINAIRTSDGTMAYFIFGDNVYSLIYNIGQSNQANFMTTFEMIIKSFKLMTS